MNLLEAIKNDVLKQKEEETLNQFSTVAEFREFILASHPTADPTANALADLTPLKRKPYLVQVTFEPGAVYKFSHADGVGFYADIAKGSVQYELGNKYKIFEVEPPLKKRKVALAKRSKRHT
ncbi:uncharacterized protein PITG_12208 [Phytophthora infestans T30-4]|uniref:Uncharacterized protein n=1 Tax=Phytophthora infestans (strain T30-4) TaxID=403677 RepID=D0NJA9_PHYIT|nr:uncharacterized protein PITG_12208 [Phytophthora infestans T30-4]EEY59627.1 conserved hypothetical protein [Phytophthora infestans T30-4]|eukprot:XP_002900820.1 conserved hypothetical protein [Phytophthora infestans T30-4]